MKTYKAKLRLMRDGKIVGDLIGDFVEDAERKPPNPSDLVPWSALFISILSLLFTLYQGYETRRNDRLAVVPHLFISRFGIADAPIGIYIENNGVGPAIIKYISISYKGKPISSVENLRNKLIESTSMTKLNLPYTAIEPGYYYRAGQRIELIKEGKDNNKLTDQTRNDVWNKFTDINIEIIYCSAYQECYTACLHIKDAACQT